MINLNLWKDLKTGPLIPKMVHAVIEIPKGSRNKYEYDLEMETFLLDRVLSSTFQYPIEYGIIPQTLFDDGNPLHILVITDHPTFPGCIISCRPIGVIKMIDEGERDNKILGVPWEDPKYFKILDIQDVPKAFLQGIERFFIEYKKLEGKKIELLGWKNVEKAYESIEYSTKLYNEMNSFKSLFLIE